MKAKRRHELKENVLAHELQQVRGFLSKYGGWIAGVILVVSVGLVIMSNMRDRRQSRLQAEWQRWTMFRDGGNIDKGDRLAGLISLANAAENAFVAASSAIWVGDLYSQDFLAEYPNMDSEKALEARDNARKYYRQAIERQGHLGSVIANAHLGLGILAENDGDMAAAEAEYKIACGLTGPAADAAKDRLEMLPTWAATGRFPTTRPTTRPAPASQPAVPDTQPAPVATQPAPVATQPAKGS